MNLKYVSTFFDIDGIFTDRSLYGSDDVINTIKFNVYDGLGCILSKELGVSLKEEDCKWEN